MTILLELYRNISNERGKQIWAMVSNTAHILAIPTKLSGKPQSWKTTLFLGKG